MGEPCASFEEACLKVQQEPEAVGFCSNGKLFWVKHSYSKNDVALNQDWTAWIKKEPVKIQHVLETLLFVRL